MDEPEGDGGICCSRGIVDEVEGAGLLVPATAVIPSLMLPVLLLLAAMEAMLITMRDSRVLLVEPGCC